MNGKSNTLTIRIPGVKITKKTCVIKNEKSMEERIEKPINRDTKLSAKRCPNSLNENPGVFFLLIMFFHGANKVLKSLATEKKYGKNMKRLVIALIVFAIALCE